MVHNYEERTIIVVKQLASLACCYEFFRALKRRILFVSVLLHIVPIALANENTIPEKMDGPIESEEAAIKAVGFLSSRVSNLAPCGEYQISANKVANEWVILESISNSLGNRASWRLWQLDALNAKVVKVTEHEWNIDLEHCSNS